MDAPRARHDPVALHRAFIRDVYAGAIGRRAPEVPTPALLLDLTVAQRNMARMARHCGP